MWLPASLPARVRLACGLLGSDARARLERSIHEPGLLETALWEELFSGPLGGRTACRVRAALYRSPPLARAVLHHPERHPADWLEAARTPTPPPVQQALFPDLLELLEPRL